MANENKFETVTQYGKTYRVVWCACFLGKSYFEAFTQSAADAFIAASGWQKYCSISSRLVAS